MVSDTALSKPNDWDASNKYIWNSIMFEHFTKKETFYKERRMTAEQYYI